MANVFTSPVRTGPAQVAEVDAALRRTARDLAARVDDLHRHIAEADADRHRIAHAVVDVRAVLLDAVRPRVTSVAAVRSIDHLCERLAVIAADLVPGQATAEADRLLAQLDQEEVAVDA